ncbi:nucleobase:cation symporter-1, NCS1 family, partial [Lecanoromycetidae sp. Uapishka_2]
MASYDNKDFYQEKNASPGSSALESESVEVGQVSGVKRRLPGFSLEVRQEPSSFAATKNASNADFDPIPPSKRTWNWGAYVAYWMADAWAVSNWEVASSIIAVGLSWKMAIGACVLGNAIMGIVITINGRMGATVQYFFALKSFIAPIVFLAIFGSTLHKAGGTVSHSTVITQPTTLSGSTLAWAFFANLNGVLGNYATLGLNIADFARYANKPSAQNVQAIVIPFIFTIVGLLGIFTAAASETAYGQVIWNPIEIVGLWMKSGSHGGRAASAFAAIGLLIVTLGINISANSISAANDLMSFCPKYINIRRGQLLAAVIGSWGFVPWKILASAAKFLAFLGGYTIFLGPMTSILITDYYIVRRGNVSVPDMYNFHGIYRYSPKYATNWRAVTAFFIGAIPPLPGFVNNIVVAGYGKTGVSAGGQHLFNIGYMYSFVSAGVFYWAFNRFVPHTESIMDHAETGEDIIAANDAKNVQERRASRVERKQSVVTTFFEV